jgi:hypothetical protein
VDLAKDARRPEPFAAAHGWHERLRVSVEAHPQLYV